MEIFTPELLMFAERLYAWMDSWDGMDVMTVYANNEMLWLLS